MFMVNEEALEKLTAVRVTVGKVGRVLARKRATLRGNVRRLARRAHYCSNVTQKELGAGAT